MGRNLSTLFISQSYQFLTQISGSELQDGLGNTITGSLAITSSRADNATSASFATTASFALNVVPQSTASLLTTASATNNVITFTKGDASTFNVTVATGSAVSTGSFATTGSNTFIGNQTITGSVNITGSIVMVNGADIVTHHVKAPAVNGVEIQNNAAGVVALFGAGGGLGTTFYGQINGTVFSGSAVTASLLGTASFAVSASQAQNAVSASFAPASSPFPFTGSAVITGSLTITGSIVTGQPGNTATGANSAVIGGGGSGGNNQANGTNSAVVGGYLGNATAVNSFVGGGGNSRITAGDRHGMVGGFDNQITAGDANFIGGGEINLARGSYSAIVGGRANTLDTSGTYNGIIGGNGNTIGNFTNTVILGGSNITAAASNTAYVRNFNTTGSAVFTGSVRGNVSALSISSNTASLDLSRGNFFTVQLVSGSNTFINPSNIQPGQTVNIRVNTTGSATVSFPSSVLQTSGSAYVPTTTTGTDIITFISFDSTNLYLSNIKNFV
jgi:hypothetical protein